MVEHRHERQDQHERRDAHHQLDQAAQQDVDPAAQVAGKRPDGDADHPGDSHRHEAHTQRNLRAVDHLGEHVVALLIGTEPVLPARSPLGARGIPGAITPFPVADPTVRVLVDQRPDGPALGVLLLEVLRIDIPKPVVAEDGIFPRPYVIAHRGEVDFPLVLADDRFGADDHRRKQGNQPQKHHEPEGQHRQLPPTKPQPRLAPEANRSR